MVKFVMLKLVVLEIGILVDVGLQCVFKLLVVSILNIVHDIINALRMGCP